MNYTTLIEPQALLDELGDPDWVIVDCRFNLDDTDAGRRAYEAGHIPGAVYAHLDDDLSGPPVTDAGRHPLPTPAMLVGLFTRLGIRNRSQVVVYDDAGGMIAARLWWMLRYMRHQAVAVLDGGWQAWQAADLPTVSGAESPQPGHFVGVPRSEQLVTLEQAGHEKLLVDSRAPERYRGEIEPRDPRPGHIPGAVNYPYGRNLDEKALLRPRAEIRKQLEAVLGDTAPEDATFYCGSGVSACVNLLSMVHAGMPEGKLYVGSWSEWSADPERPAATSET